MAPEKTRGRVCGYAFQVAPKFESRVVYALELLFEHMGIPAQRVDEPTADVVYGPAPSRAAPYSRVWIRADRIEDWDSPTPKIDPWQSVPLLYQSLVPEPVDWEGGAIPADILYSTYALATGVLERRQLKNRFGVPLGAGSTLQAAGLLQIPAIARYSSILSDILRRRCGDRFVPIELWPPGKRFAIVSSHDVDAPFSTMRSSYHARRVFRELGERQILPAAKSCYRWMRAAIKQAVGLDPSPDRDPNFCFRAWQELEGRLPTKSCFYVAVTSSADRGSVPEDVEYCFRDKAIIRALRLAEASGWEIGLHASINSKQAPSALEAEKRALERFLREPVVGVRHHYWALDPELPERTLWAHAAAGLRYDSSLGMNDVSGFRRGLAWPFHPFDREQNKAVPILQIPPTLMDGGIFYREVDEQQGSEEIKNHIKCVSDHRGCVVLDWHLEQLNPAHLHRAGPVLAKVLLELANDSGVYWASPAELAVWWERRRESLKVQILSRRSL